METVQNTDVQESQPGRVRLFIGQLSWRVILVRLAVNGLSLIVVAILVPNIYFVDRSLLSVLLMAAVLGILNVFVKPIVQFLTLPFIFATYGFVIVLINAIILILLALIFEERFYVGGLFWAIVGGLVMGIAASFLESLLGLNLPIVAKSQGANGSPAPGPRTITDVWADELAGDEAVQPALGADVSDPTQAEDSSEPPRTTVADMGGHDAAPTDDEGPAPTEEEGPSRPQDGEDDEQPGDEG